MRMLSVVLAVLVMCGCGRPNVRGPFRNQYVDAETGKPIAGVVFLAVWHTTNINFASGGSENFVEAREAVSGPDGSVEIPELGWWEWRPTLDVRFYEMGFDGYSSADVRKDESQGQVFVTPTITSMRRETSVDRRIKNIPSLPSVPDEKMRNYIGAVDRELAANGLPRHYPEGQP